MKPSLRILPAILIPIATSFFGCATPGPLVRLYPSLPNVVWVSGRASMTREEGGIRVAAAFDHQDGPNLGVRVEVENTTDGLLDVDPSAFTFTTCGGTAVASCAPTQAIIDPERVLAALDERQSRERADAANSQTALGALVILSAVGDVATVASGHADANTGNATVASAALMESDANARDSSLGSISMQQGIWANEALRRNTVFPGRGTGGRVYLPINLNAQYVWLHVKAGGRVFSFPFKQVVTQLTPTGAQQTAHAHQ